MKPGDTMTLEKRAYAVSRIYPDGAVRLRLLVTRREFDRRVRDGRWRRLVSGTFLVDVSTGQTVSNWEMMALGVPAKRIERLHAKLPVVGQDVGAEAN